VQVLPDNGVLIEEEQCTTKHNQSFVKACDIKVDDVMDKVVGIIGHFLIFTDIPYAEEESWFSCIGGVGSY
jgi:hypothetical protein